MDDKELIRAASGTITAVYKAKRSKEGAEHTYAMQDMVIKDATGEIRVMIKDREPADDVPQGWKGKKVVIEAHQSDKGYTGVYAHDDTWKMRNGKSKTVERMIRVTPTGQIYLEGADATERKRELTEEAPAKASPPKGQPEARAGAQREAKELTAEEREWAQNRAVLDFKKALAKSANAYCLALDVVKKVIDPHYCELFEEDGMPYEIVRNAVSTVFITARDKAFEVAPLPVKPIHEPPPPPPGDDLPPSRPAQPQPGADDDEIPF